MKERRRSRRDKQTGGEAERRVGFTRREQKRRGKKGESILRMRKRGGDDVVEAGCGLGNGALAMTGSKWWKSMAREQTGQQGVHHLNESSQG